jgi:catalase
LRGSPSFLFDAVAILAGPDGDKAFAADPDAVSFLMDACRHLKAIALAGIPKLAAKANASGQVGVTELTGTKDISGFVQAARNGKVWEREGR